MEAQVGCHLRAVTLMEVFSRADSPRLVLRLPRAAVSLAWPRLRHGDFSQAHGSPFQRGCHGLPLWDRQPNGDKRLIQHWF